MYGRVEVEWRGMFVSLLGGCDGILFGALNGLGSRGDGSGGWTGE
jgi:hypothetical protein